MYTMNELINETHVESWEVSLNLQGHNLKEGGGHKGEYTCSQTNFIKPTFDGCFKLDAKFEASTILFNKAALP